LESATVPQVDNSEPVRLASMSRRRIAGRILAHAVLIGIGVFYLMPLVWLISTSLKATRQIFVYPPEWIPNPVIWRNYVDMFTYAPFHRYAMNTALVVILNLFGTIFSCSLVAYGFARFPHVRGNRVLFIVMLSTMMLPYMVWLIPLYIVYSKIGWVDTFLPLIVPSFFGVPLFIFLLRQFLMTVPQELGDAARIDGCSHLQTFFRVMMPLIKPALATVAIFTFINHWHELLGPLIFLQSPSKFTIAIGLRVFQTVHSTKWGLLMAASTTALLPVIIVFFFAQRQFIQGITLTGLKG